MRSIGWNSTQLALDLAGAREPRTFWPLSPVASAAGQLTEGSRQLTLQFPLESSYTSEILQPAWTMRACVEDYGASGGGSATPSSKHG